MRITWQAHLYTYVWHIYGLDAQLASINQVPRGGEEPGTRFRESHSIRTHTYRVRVSAGTRNDELRYYCGTERKVLRSAGGYRSTPPGQTFSNREVRNMCHMHTTRGGVGFHRTSQSLFFSPDFPWFVVAPSWLPSCTHTTYSSSQHYWLYDVQWPYYLLTVDSDGCSVLFFLSCIITGCIPTVCRKEQARRVVGNKDTMLRNRVPDTYLRG